METIYLALRAQIAVGNFFTKSPVSKGQIIKRPNMKKVIIIKG